MLDLLGWVYGALDEEEKFQSDKKGLSEDEYVRMEKIFHRAKVLMTAGFWLSLAFLVILSYRFWSEGVWEIGLVPFAKKYPFSWVALLPLLVSSKITFEGYAILDDLLVLFVKKSKIQEAADAFRDASRGEVHPYPDFLHFAYFGSLRDFEQYYVRLYSEGRRKCIKLRHMEKGINQIDQRIEILKREEGVLAERAESALSKLPNEDDISRYRGLLRKATTIKGVGRLVEEIENKAVEKADIENRQSAKVESLVSDLLECAREYGMCLESHELVAKATTCVNHKQKVSYLKAAISAQKVYNKKKESVCGDAGG
jgi:hypothetical protein